MAAIGTDELAGLGFSRAGMAKLNHFKPLITIWIFTTLNAHAKTFLTTELCTVENSNKRLPTYNRVIQVARKACCRQE